MRNLFLLIALTLGTLPVSATPQAPGYENAGQCAGPIGSRCRYTLEVIPGPMVNDPYFGWSRVETVNFCLQEAGVTDVNDLITDEHLYTYEGCMIEQT